MRIYRSFSLLLITLLVLGLVACVRSIPGTAKATSTAEEESILPTSATDVMNQIYLFATQTAMAKMENTPGAQAATEPASAPVATELSLSTPTTLIFATPQPVIPSSTPAPLIATPPLVVPSEYTLKKGEFPYCIARRFNVNPSELLSVNGLSSGTLVHSGMTLQIPQTGRPFPGNRSLRAHPTSYTVSSGDTIYAISCYFGDVDPNAIAVVNGLTPPYGLSSGQVLRIP